MLTAAAIVSIAGQASAQNQALTCWYNDHADFTSADSAPASAVIGSVAKASSGDKTFSYTISARDGMACPVQLPLSTTSAVTVALVRQDEGDCSNEKVSDAGGAAVGGSVTVYSESRAASTAAIRLAGLAPNTSYKIFLKCLRQLGTLRTDANGNAGRTVSFPTDGPGPVFAFEVTPEGDAAGTKLQSLSFKK